MSVNFLAVELAAFSLLLISFLYLSNNSLIPYNPTSILPPLAGILFTFINFSPFDIIMAIKDVFVDIRDERFSKEALKSRYEKAESVFLTMRRYVIAFSLLGSIILFVKSMYRHSEEGNFFAVIFCLSVAIIPLFFGLIISELICLPMATQIRRKQKG